jgi:deazaflavin-dependent oxidoreductase (nitroreductase family)
MSTPSRLRAIVSYARPMSDWNTPVIEEFRANAGVVGGHWEGRTLLLLHHQGAKSGTWRVTPLACRRVGEGWAIFATKAGADTNPAWYHNLKAHPEVRIEVGADTLEVKATQLEGERRDAVYAEQAAEWQAFADYEKKTDRRIPVMLLEPR